MLKFPFFTLKKLNKEFPFYTDEQRKELVYLCPDAKYEWFIIAKEYHANLFSEEKIGVMTFRTSNKKDMLAMLDLISCVCGDQKFKDQDKFKILAWLLSEAFTEYPVFLKMKNEL